MLSVRLNSPLHFAYDVDEPAIITVSEDVGKGEEMAVGTGEQLMCVEESKETADSN